MADDKLTRKSQEAISDAVRRATEAGNPSVDGLHLLAALIEQEGGTAAPLLRAVGATVSAPETSRQVLAALSAAAKRAREMSDEYVSTEHLLVGLASDGGEAAALLRQAGAGPDQLLAAFEQVRGHARVTSPD